MLGGLNYQIEHHLFPSVARANLRKVQPIVRDFCAERGVDYLQVGAVASYRAGPELPQRGRAQHDGQSARIRFRP